LSAPPASSREAGPGAAAEPQIHVDLSVLAPRTRAGLESDRIAVLYPDRHFDYFAGARWSGPLSEVLRDLTVQEFRSHANLHSVGTDASVFASTYWLEIEATDFQAEYSSGQTPTVHVRLLARLGSSGDRHILGQFIADAEQPAAENRLSSIVDAFARAADASLSTIVAQAVATLAKTSEAR
jgi:ABC-type uncharacterized transport system auxiliary subunit